MNSSNQNSVKPSTKNDSPRRLYKEFKVLTFYNDPKTQIICHSEDQKTLFIVLNISQVNNSALYIINGNIKFNDLIFLVGEVVQLPWGLPKNPFYLIKNNYILGGPVKTLRGIQSKLNIIDDTQSQIFSMNIKAFSDISTKNNSDTIATYSSPTCGCCYEDGECKVVCVSSGTDCSKYCKIYGYNCGCTQSN